MYHLVTDLTSLLTANSHWCSGHAPVRNSAIGVGYLQVSISKQRLRWGGQTKGERYCSEMKSRRRGGQNEKPRPSGSQDFSMSVLEYVPSRGKSCSYANRIRLQQLFYSCGENF